ncbi:MAG: UDP-glucose/GDP-mannose dehydrogenase family protein [Nanoarchaeota archaeon]|nr:UDP-glucose/GDP-mannose dehydrogenase family protein [Nanoarchaeota archaeon]
MNISIFGTGYVGLVTGACLANFGHAVCCMDVDVQKIALLQQGTIPFYEQGLKDLAVQNQKRLHFTTNAEEAVCFGEVLFNCVGTPSRGDGGADLQAVFAVVDAVAHFAFGYKVLVNKSTVPPGTARECQERLKKLTKAEVDVVSNPEFLKQGNAVYDFNHPDKIVIGAPAEKPLHLMQKVYHGLIKTYIPLIETDWETAEITKYANNAFLATKISFINEIANICDAVGADVKVVTKALGMDQRIGPKFLNAGMGYGGSCFPKDIRALSHVAKKKGYNPFIFPAVDAFNERQKVHLFPKIMQALQEVGGNTVTFWGLSFKPKTSDIREAPALALLEHLLAQGVSVRAFDPVALDEARKLLGEKVTYCSSIEESVMGSNAIILATEWDEFRNIDFAALGKLMKTRLVFDGRNVYDPNLVRQDGFRYYGVGRR